MHSWCSKRTGLTFPLRCIERSELDTKEACSLNLISHLSTHTGAGLPLTIFRSMLLGLFGDIRQHVECVALLAGNGGKLISLIKPSAEPNLSSLEGDPCTCHQPLLHPLNPITPGSASYFSGLSSFLRSRYVPSIPMFDKIGYSEASNMASKLQALIQKVVLTAPADLRSKQTGKSSTGYRLPGLLSAERSDL